MTWRAIFARATRIYWRKLTRAHARCLRRIAAYEQTDRWAAQNVSKSEWLDDEFDMRPGAKWIVDDVNHVQILAGYGLLASGMAHKMAVERKVMFG